MNRRESSSRTWNGRRLEAAARDAAADERERLADQREDLANERAALADLRDSLADERERELARRLGEAGDPRSALEKQSAVAQMAFALDRVKLAEAAVRRAEAERVEAQEALDRMVARRQRDQDRTERDDVPHPVGDERRDEAVWAAERRDFVAFDREQVADAREQLADRRDKAADEREDESDSRDRILRRWEAAVRCSEGGALVDGDAQSSRLDLDALRRSAQQRRSRRVVEQRSRPPTLRSVGAEPDENGSMLTASFASLAQELITASDLSPALRHLLTLAVGAVDACDCASISLLVGTEAGANVATDETAAALDTIQFRERDGPAVEALGTRHPVYVADLSQQSSGLLAAAADAATTTSALCLGLRIKRSGEWHNVGVMSLYAPDLDAFSDADREIVGIFAAFAAAMIGLAQARHDLQQREAALHRSLSTRDIIGQAKGILMERERLSAGQAFDRLRRASQQLNRKLTDIARQLAETGEMGTS